MSVVVIAGAGPVGLMLACELKLNGIEAAVLEPLAEIDQRIKAGAVQGRGVELLERRGLVEPIQALLPEHTKQLQSTMAGRGMRGHFAGIWALRASAYEVSPMLPVMQQTLEQVLGERAAELGVEVRRGWRVRSYQQDPDGVTVEAEGPEGVVPLRADWLVGADGGRSVVRKLGGFAFPGTDGVITGYQAVAELDDPDFLPRGWNRCPGGMVVNGPFPGRLLVVGFDGPPTDREAPATREEFEAALRRTSGTEVGVRSVGSLTRFTDNARLADSYRAGRVLLAGDAAHVHSPFGGQGLNLGLGDAANLGWKLALVACGKAPEALLDSYTAERRPVAARVLDNTRAQVALMRPGPHVDALRELFTRLLDQDDANRWLTDLMGGNDIRYPGESDRDEVGRVCPAGLTVKTAEGPVLLTPRHRSGRAQLVLADADAMPTGWADRVDLTVGSCDGPEGLLVRPDGYVAWTSDSDEPLSTALTRWLGPAR
ncbi:FAD-dependent monooxygenase [Streptacidiphilus sp. PAMC 29251]